MDRLIHTALNSIANQRDQKQIVAQNLANVAVPGYRRDLPNENATKFLEQFDSLTTRAFQTETDHHTFLEDPGVLNGTGESMDVAIADKGYFIVQPENGEPALTRRGDLRITADGTLRNGAGDQMLDPGGQPIVLPPFRSMHVNALGEIAIEPRDGAPGAFVTVATLGTVVPPEDMRLSKSEDGNIRPVDAEIPPADQQAQVKQGYLEASNVNSVDELVNMMEIQRAFELGIKLITTAKEADEAGSQLLTAPEG